MGEDSKSVLCRLISSRGKIKLKIMRCVFETNKTKEGFTGKRSEGYEGMRGLPRAKDPR